MIPFSKYSGAGNDFVIVEAADLRNETAADLARRICPRRTGVGVDGLALVDRLASNEGADGPLRIRFFNPDGSEFATCGNGTRCVARHAADTGHGPEPRLRTAAGEIGARVEGDRVTLDYRIDVEVLREVEVPFGEADAAVGEDREGDATRRGWLVRNDTPHLVVPVASLPEDDDRFLRLCHSLRHHPSLGPEGANVNLVRLRDRASGAIRTYERGVEDETLACGAGCISSTVALHAAGACDDALRLHTRSGHELVVELLSEASGPRRIRLTGPAVRIFDGRFPGA